MLNWFRYKRWTVVPVVTAIFLSGLFSFFCPHCLAKMVMEANTAVINSNAHDHCAHMKAGKQGPVHSRNHCNGSCGCEDRAMLIGTRHLATLNDSKGFPDIWMPVLNDSSGYNLSVSHYLYTIGRPYKPDRACFSPLERNCVLLN